MTFSQRAVEAAAEALDIAMDSFEKGVQVDSLTPDEHAYLANVALTTALAVDGVALVPKEPTSAMIEAGCENNPTQWNEGTDLGFAADVANDVYRAMLSAASEGEERK